MGGGTGTGGFTPPILENHDAASCSSCKGEDGNTEAGWLKRHSTKWCKESDTFIGRTDNRYSGEDLSVDGHHRCAMNGGMVYSKKRDERYGCQCICHVIVSDADVEAAAFGALQLMLKMRSEHAEP
jgi:hypothetical protein